METLSVTEARATLFKLVDSVSQTHKPVHIHGKKSKVVLLSEEDFEALQETIYLMGVPGLYQDLKKGVETPITKCVADMELEW